MSDRQLWEVLNHERCRSEVAQWCPFSFLALPALQVDLHGRRCRQRTIREDF